MAFYFGEILALLIINVELHLNDIYLFDITGIQDEYFYKRIVLVTWDSSFLGRTFLNFCRNSIISLMMATSFHFYVSPTIFQSFGIANFETKIKSTNWCPPTIGGNETILFSMLRFIIHQWIASIFSNGCLVLYYVDCNSC